MVLRSGSEYTRVQRLPPHRYPSGGWRIAATLSCVTVALVLVLNIIFTTYVVKNYPPNEDSIGQFDSTDCEQVHSNNGVLHVALNIVATVLVGASNYNMQCLTAPIREEVDGQHKKDSSLDIGIQSVRKLRYLPRWKVALWTSLLVSTLPLHLLWNSAVFAISELNNYGVVVVTSDYLEAPLSYDVSCQELTTLSDLVTCSMIGRAKRNDPTLTRLSPKKCIQAFAKKLETPFFNVLAVAKASGLERSSLHTQHTAAGSPLLAYIEATTYAENLTGFCGCTNGLFGCNSTLPQYCEQYNNGDTNWQHSGVEGTSEWICDIDHLLRSGCAVSDALENSTHWTILPEHYEIGHCVASRRQSACRFQYSATILYMVVACNVVKLLAISLNLVFAQPGALAMTGDAVVSFLDRPEPKSNGTSLKSLTWWASAPRLGPLRWRSSRKRIRRLAHVISLGQWVAFSLW